MSDTDVLDVDATLNELDGLDVESTSVRSDESLDFDEPETPATTATTEPSSDANPSPTDEAGQPRDERGRFAPKSEGDTAAVQAPTATDPNAQANLPADATASPEPAATPEWKPFSLKVGQKDEPLPGAHVMEQGEHTYLLMNPEAKQRFQQMVNSGREAERKIRDIIALERSMKERESAPKPPDPDAVAGKVAVEHLERLIGGDPETVELFNANPTLWLKQIMLDARERIQTEGARVVQEAQSKEQEASQRQELDRWFVKSVADLYDGNRSTFPGLTPDDVKQIFVEEIDPIKDSLIGNQNGFAVLNEQYVRRLFQARSETALARREAEEARKRAAVSQSATRFNQAQMAGVKPPTAQAAVSPRRTAAPSSKAPATVPGKKKFEDAFRDWTKKPGLDFGDDE